MYRVQWDDHEGNRHQISFDSLEDARLEAEALKTKYDYVEIVKGDHRMKEQLFTVGIQHIKTGEKINLQVWAKNVNEATWGLRGVISYNTEYRWTGSGPVYDENGNVITREVPA